VNPHIKGAMDVEVQYQNNVDLLRDIIHFEFVPKGAIANQTFYMEVLKKPFDAMRHGEIAHLFFTTTTC
jgi:hypothetical protein